MNRNDWGGADYRDLMAGLDMLIAKGIADPDKLVVWGGSYGGYMANWIVTQTDRFKAAHSEVSISDLVSMWSLSPIGRLLCGLYFDKTPIEDPGFYRRLSPLTYAGGVKTPLLLTQNEKDQRVGPSPGQAMEFYRALEGREVPVRLYVYPGEGHATRTPVHQLDKLEKGFVWFEKYLGRNSGR
jgi:dipeptidyl aminopeptidase/acylaminoacyl peptidase